MRHPTDGTLRRLVDEPAGVADADREHVAQCAVCLTGLATAREDAAVAADALRHEADADVDAGWSRLSRALAVEEPRRVAAPAAKRGLRDRLRSPVVAVVGAVAVLTGATAAAAADWLPIFRTQQVAPVALTEADLLQLPDLEAYGELELTQEPDVREVATATAAEQATGLPVPVVRELPHGVTGDPVYRVGDQASAVFTFSLDQAAQAAAGAGETLPPPPPGIDGAQFRLTAGPGVAAVWTEARGIPAMIVARAVAPTAYSSGVPFETARDYLLSLPGLPERLAAQLRSFSGDGTLPLPLPADEVTTSQTDVDGVPATVVESRDGALAAVLWVDDGVVNAVAGLLGKDEVLAVARDLR